MPEANKVLGQSAPTANTDTVLYTVPSGKEAVISTLFVCNRDVSADMTFRIAVSPAGAAIANPHYLYYDAVLAAGATVTITTGITLGATDVVRVRSSIGNATFNAFGVEVTP